MDNHTLEPRDKSIGAGTKGTTGKEIIKFGMFKIDREIGLMWPILIFLSPSFFLCLLQHKASKALHRNSDRNPYISLSLADHQPEPLNLHKCNSC